MSVCVTVYVYVNMYTYMQLIYLICIYTLYNMAARCERRNAQKEELVLQFGGHRPPNERKRTGGKRRKRIEYSNN